MNIAVAKENIYVLKNQYSTEQAQELAWGKKTNAFDTFSKVASFLSRPKDDDFEIVYSEHRYEPFWHVVAKAKYVYDRSASYQVPTTSPVVTRVTLHQTDYETTNGHLLIPVIEHCVQNEKEEVFINGLTGTPEKSLADYLISPKAVVADKIEKLTTKGSIIVPPQIKISGIMRDALAKMIKGIQADTILEEEVSVDTIDLYYHPIFAYKIRWNSKNKEGLIEVDGVTGIVGSGRNTFAQYLGKSLDQDFLFDIGADAADMILPGGSIAVKAARKYIDNKKKK